MCTDWVNASLQWKRWKCCNQHGSSPHLWYDCRWFPVGVHFFIGKRTKKLDHYQSHILQRKQGEKSQPIVGTWIVCCSSWIICQRCVKSSSATDVNQVYLYFPQCGLDVLQFSQPFPGSVCHFSNGSSESKQVTRHFFVNKRHLRRPGNAPTFVVAVWRLDLFWSNISKYVLPFSFSFPIITFLNCSKKVSLISWREGRHKTGKCRFLVLCFLIKILHNSFGWSGSITRHGLFHFFFWYKISKTLIPVSRPILTLAHKQAGRSLKHLQCKFKGFGQAEIRNQAQQQFVQEE